VGWSVRRCGRGGEEIGDGGEGGDVVGGGEFGATGGVGFDERGELEEIGVRGLELAVDAEVVAPEGAGADDGDAKGSGGIARSRYGFAHGLLFFRCSGGRDGGLDGFAATGVEAEHLGDLIVRLGGGGKAKAGCGRGGFAADVGVGRDELEQVEGDVFGAAGGVGAGFHECLSMQVLEAMVAVG
jgi:hypothetical protein